MRRIHVAWALALLCSCGGDGGGGGTSPTSAQQAAVQSADTSSGTIQQSVTVSTNEVVDSGSSGASEGTPTGGVAINFQSSVTRVVDLDAPGKAGTDRYPNATGTFVVTGSGSVSGTSASGSASYAVTLTFQTDCVFTNPSAGTQATVAAGSSFAFDLDVTWSRTDADNWTISTSSNTTVSNFSVAATDGTSTYTATVNATRSASATFGESAGVFNVSWSPTSYTTVTWSDGTTTHTVTFDVASLSSITITVDGFTFGPYTAAEIVAIFRALIT